GRGRGRAAAPRRGGGRPAASPPPGRPPPGGGGRPPPPVSVPWARGAPPGAPATAEPLEDPPGASEASSGLTGVPNQGLIPVTPSASSCMFALPTICAPAARRPARQAASWPAGTAASATTRDAAVGGVPATSIMSFTATRSPGPWTPRDLMNLTD